MAGDTSSYARRGYSEDRGGGNPEKPSSSMSGSTSGKDGLVGGREWGSQQYRYRDRDSAMYADKSMPLETAMKGVEEADEATDQALRCAAVVLDSDNSNRVECECVLAKINQWLQPSVNRQALPQIANSALPSAVVKSLRKFRSEPPTAAACCVVLNRSAGSTTSAQAYLRVGALEEVGELMDAHPAHGGIQNVTLLVLCCLMKDSGVARQAVQIGMVPKVLRAMEATSGREVQFNGLNAIRLLIESGRAQRTGLQETALRAKVAHQNDDTVSTAADEVLAIVTPRFKEVLCWHWQSGWCKLGPRCTYAHGPDDLRG
mmetsp:Transcript_66821/g.139534  ORF Transcript_66821/g.139534 Transcript_66821/m.139534 type:complete len:317 (+) Transcript_66821:125-1075(+)